MTDGTLYPFETTQGGAEEAYVSSLNVQTTSETTQHADRDEDAVKPVSFVGRSGKTYAAKPTLLENLRIRDDQLCLLCVRNQQSEDILWVGSGQSLVHDQPNRAEFLDVVNKADKAYIIEIVDSAEQSLASWDLSNTHHNLPHAA